MPSQNVDFSPDLSIEGVDIESVSEIYVRYQTSDGWKTLREKEPFERDLDAVIIAENGDTFKSFLICGAKKLRGLFSREGSSREETQQETSGSRDETENGLIEKLR